MTEAKADGIYNLTSPVPLLFPNLLVPKAFMKNGKAQGEPKYSGTLEFEVGHPDLEGMKALAGKLAKGRWPDKPFSELAFPFSSGDKAADKRKAAGKDGEHSRGKVLLKSSSKYEPRLSVIVDGKIIDIDSEMLKQAHKGKFYNGVEVLAQLNFVTYDAIGENAKGGVTAYLNIVMSTGKGKRLSGGATAAEVFKGYAGAVSTEDPTGGVADDQIPF